MKLLKPLVMMQLKDKLDLSFLKSKKQTITKVVFGVLLFVAVVVFTYLMFYLAKRFNVFSLINFVPVSVLTVIFTIMLALSTLATTYSLMKSLYFSKDNILLLTFPVSANMVFLSKLIVFYVYEVKRTVSFLLPLFIGYGAVNGFGLVYYLWIVFAFIFISAIPVAVGALLSIPAMLVSQFLKQRAYLQLVLFAGVLVLGFYAVLKAINLIPSNINIIGTWGTVFWAMQDFLNNFVLNFAPFHQVTLMLVGEFRNFTQVLITGQTFPTLLILIAGLAAVFGLSFVLTKPLFFKMSSKPFEFRKKLIKKQKPNVKRDKFVSAIRKEFVINFRTTELLASNFSLFAILPISIFLLNKIYAAMNTDYLGSTMTVAFNILVILLIILSSNFSIASAYSKEGASGYLTKTKPAAYHISLLSKLVFNASTITLSLMVTMAILQFVTDLPTGQIVMFFFTMLFVYLAHLVWSAELDIMNPQNSQYATTGTHTSNPNENKSTIFAFLLSFLFFGIALFLFGEGMFWTWVRLLLIAIAFFAGRAYLFLEKIRVYYKEIV